MKRATLGDLATAPYDILIVGGGIYGVMAAREAALRGLRTAIIERGDWGGETSYNSLKLMHGGIRYVQHFDFTRLRASAREREFWQRAAPDLVRPLEFMIPMLGYGIKGPVAFGVAAELYNLASGSLRGAAYPRARVVGRRRAGQVMKDLAPAGLTGGGVWRDGQIQDCNRLLLAGLKAAVDAGADAANYVRAAQPILQQGRVVGAAVTDQAKGGSAEIRAKVTLSCTGGAAAGFAAPAIGPRAQQEFPKFARAMNLVIDRALCDRGMGIVSRSRSDAVVDRGGRMYFLTPWQGRTIIGTHEAPFEPGTDGHSPDPDQVSAFLEEINLAAPALKLTPDQIAYCYTGLIPADTDDAANAVQRQTRGTLIDHSQGGGPAGLITAVGVKYTTARLIAERAVALAAAQIGRDCPPGDSLATPLPQVGPSYQAGQAVDAQVQDEMVLTLSDLLMRRSLLAETGALRGAKGDPTIQAAAAALADRLGWDDQTRAAQVDQVKKRLIEHKFK